MGGATRGSFVSSADRASCVRDEVPGAILQEANASWEIIGRVRADAWREPLRADGAIVGFVSPHETAWGWRHGPMFVLPAYRRRGLVLAYYAAHAERRCVAFVADLNTASRAMHSRAGFVHWRRGNGGAFVRREAIR